VMIEHNKCGPDMKAALANSGIFYCYLDDFYSGDSEELKTNALLQEMRDYMEKAVQLNAIDMLNDALRSTRIEMTAAERQQFYDKYIKTLQLSINDDGKVSLVIKVKIIRLGAVTIPSSRSIPEKERQWVNLGKKNFILARPCILIEPLGKRPHHVREE